MLESREAVIAQIEDALDILSDFGADVEPDRVTVAQYIEARRLVLEHIRMLYGAIDLQTAIIVDFAG